MSTLALLATPSAKGLYQKAIVESGLGWLPPITLDHMQSEGVEAATKLGLPGADASLDQLRAVPAEDLIARLHGTSSPFPDGKLLPETATQAFADGHAADVPLIIGSNSGEDSLLGPGPIPAPRLAAFVSPTLRTLYKDESAAGGDELVARAVFTDRVMGGPARWVAAKASTGQPAWLYHFSYIGSRFRPGKTRASHADEIQYMLEYWGRRTPMSLVSDQDKQMASLMHACWVSFVKAGAPKCGSTPWPAYTPARDQLFEFSAKPGVRTHFRKAELDAQQASEGERLGFGK